MSVRTKSIILVLCTFVVGAGVGVWGTSALQHRRMQALEDARRQGGIMRRIERVIEFESDTQRDEVAQIIRQAEAAFTEQRRAFGDSVAVYREAMMRALEAALTPEQLESVQARVREHRSSRHRRGERRAPSEHEHQGPRPPRPPIE